MTTLLLLLACVEKPDGPPPPPNQPSTVDTAGGLEAVEGAAVDGVDRPPRIQELRVLPEALVGTKPARAEFKVFDPEDGFISEDLRWSVNGKEVPGATGQALAPTHFKRGDLVEVTLTVSDGAHEVVLVSAPRIVENSSPRIEVPRSGLSGAIDGFQVQGSDPDGDPLTWSVVNGPPGLSVNDEGVLSYAPQPVEGEGRIYEAEVRCEDEGGLFASWPLVIDLKPGRPAAQESAAP